MLYTLADCDKLCPLRSSSLGRDARKLESSGQGHRQNLGLCLSVDRLSLQHLVCQCIVFQRSLLLTNPQETQSQLFKIWVSPSLLNEWATPWLSFGGIERFQTISGSLLHESMKTHSKSSSTDTYARVFQNDLFQFANQVNRRTDTTLPRKEETRQIDRGLRKKWTWWGPIQEPYRRDK